MQLTNCLLRLSPLVLTCHIGLACAQITTPSAGTYVRKGGGGDLVVRANGKFHIQTVGANGHTCELERSEEHTSELQSPCNLVCRLLLEKKKRRSSRPSPNRSRSSGAACNSPPPRHPGHPAGPAP